ncbi:hypothetical protein [Polluticaenibacter yanchengensis]|uniref:DUF4288 domain-containing protein n=1 Tax=Polluticaenibacter yanchengensis TaxID=3014562 RepID=A0ABT4UNA2_9BACT|nr:hypothetical protein [Chitinophagaceae bacterium LY-5]
MKLTHLIKEIENIDEEAIIFQEDKGDPNSDIMLSFAEEGDEGVKEVEGRKYYYLIEVFLAKEFVEDWEASLGYKPTLEEKAKRLYDYAINDA